MLCIHSLPVMFISICVTNRGSLSIFAGIKD